MVWGGLARARRQSAKIRLRRGDRGDDRRWVL